VIFLSDYEEGFKAGFDAGLDAARRDIGKDMGTVPRGSLTPTKRKRKASKYNMMYAKIYKQLKKKHPRTSFAALAKKAHRETKRRLK